MSSTPWIFEYHWYHALTEQRGTSSYKSAHPLTELEQLRLVNGWNQVNPKEWVYWC